MAGGDWAPPVLVRLFEGGEVLDKIAEFAFGKDRGKWGHARGATFAGFDQFFLDFFDHARGGHEGEVFC